MNCQSNNRTFTEPKRIPIDICQLKKLEEKLKQAEKKEEIANMAVGIAHDFNNILTAVIGYTDLALQHVDPCNNLLVNDLDQIMAASRRARDLVQQILQFGRNSDDNTKPVSLAPVINEALNCLKSTLPPTIELQSELDGRIYSLVSPINLHQILMNLCTNACHAMKSKGGILSVQLQHKGFERDRLTKNLLSPHIEYCEINVSDTGHGIEPEILSRIFEPYFTSKEIGEGTGLGLAVVHRLVKTCNGEILVNSVVNSGTDFHIYLPIAKSFGTSPINYGTKK